MTIDELENKTRARFKKSIDNTAQTSQSTSGGKSTLRKQLEELAKEENNSALEANNPAFVYSQLYGSGVTGKKTNVAQKSPAQTTAKTKERKPGEINALGAGDYGASKKTRLDSTLNAAAYNAAGSVSNLLGLLDELDARTKARDAADSARLKAGRDASEKGEDISTRAGGLKKQSEDSKKLFEKLYTELKGAGQKKLDTADELMQRATEEQNAAKAGLGKFGQGVVDFGIAGTQFAGDALLNTVLPGAGLAAMGMRAAGGGAYEARKEGVDLSGQLTAGMKSAAVELLTEKLFGAGSKIAYGKGLIKNQSAVNGIVNRLAKTDKGRTALKVLLAANEEGAEEVLADILNPLSDYALDIRGADGELLDEFTFEQAAENYIIGALLGGMGAGGNIISGQYKAENSRQREKEEYQSALVDAAERAGDDVKKYKNIIENSNKRGKRTLNDKETAELEDIVYSPYVELRLDALSGKSSPETAKAIIKAARGEKLTKAEQKAFDANPYSQRVVNEMTETGTANTWYAAMMNNVVYPEEREAFVPDSDSAQSIIEEGLSQPEGSAAQRYASRLREKALEGETITEEETAELKRLMTAPLELEDAETIAEPRGEILDLVSEDEYDKAQELKAKYAQAIKDGLISERRIYDAIRDGENTEDIIRENARKQLKKEAEGLPTEMLNAMADYVAAGGKLTTAIETARNITEEAENERREQNTDNGVGRESRVDTGEQTGSVQESTGRTEENKRTERGSQETGRKDIPKAHRVSSREIGISAGTNAKTLTIDNNPNATAKRIMKAFEKAANGFVAVKGNIETKQGTVQGVTTADGKVIFRTDHRMYGQAEILLHECGHLYIRDDSDMKKALKEACLESMSEKQLKELALKYGALWQGVMNESMTDEEFFDYALEEIYCDALAGIDRISARGALRLTEAVRGAFEEETGIDVDALLSGKEASETAVTTEKSKAEEIPTRNNGPPSEGEKYSYAGERARTSNYGELYRAKEMKHNGVNAEEIYNSTGWFVGADGKWRFEIDDSNMEFRKNGDARLLREENYRRLEKLTQKWADSFEGGEALTEAEEAEMETLQDEYQDAVWENRFMLSDFLKHDKLFDAYPRLNSVELRFGDLPGGVNGLYNKRDNTIYLSNSLFGKEADVLIHEIQHILQKYEGFAKGSSPEYWNNKIKQAGADVLEARHAFKSNKEIAELYRRIERGEIDEELFDEELAEILQHNTDAKRKYDAMRQAERVENLTTAAGTSGYELYRNTAGEIEARDTAERRSLTAEQRRKIMPNTGDENTVFVEDGYSSANAEEKLSIDEPSEEAARQAKINSTDDEKNKQKFSMDEPIEEKKNLIALHNLNETKLLKTLKLGGFAMPSIAITKNDIPHTNFGDITVVFGKETIDPKFDKRNTVYSADAWTPVFPRVEYEAAPAVEAKIRDKYYELARKNGYELLKPMYSSANYVEDVLNNYGGEKGVIEHFADDTGMMQVFLADTTGKTVENIKTEHVTKLSDNQIEEYDVLISALGKDVINEMQPKAGQSPMAAQRAWIEKHGEELKAAYRQYLVKSGLSEESADDVMKDMKVGSLLPELIEARNYMKNGAETRREEVDTAATKEAIKNAVNMKEYKAWLEDLYKGVEKSSGVYNQKDYYTAAGNRRSFKQTHFPATLGGIVKAMTAQGDGNSRNVMGFHGVKSLRAGTAERFKSIEDMHKREGRLKHLTQEETDEIIAALDERLSEVMHRIYDAAPHSAYSNELIELDAIGEILVEAGELKSINVDSIKKLFRKYNHNLNNELAKDVTELLYDIEQMPVNIFEAKPERAVGFDEVRAVIIPNTASEELRSALKNAGIDNVVEYEKGNDAERMKKANEVPDIRFSVDDADGLSVRASRMSVNTLRDRLSRIEGMIRGYEMTEELSEAKQKELDKLKENRDIFKEALEEKKKKAKANRASEAEAGKTNAEKMRTSPTAISNSAENLVTSLLDTFHINENKAEARRFIRATLAQWQTRGNFTKKDIDHLEDYLLTNGVETVEADDTAAEVRNQLYHSRIYVNPAVVTELGDEWNSLRRRAFGAGIYLTSKDINAGGIDSHYMELQDAFGNIFGEETDLTAMLEQMITIAEDGKAENMSLYDYAKHLDKRERTGGEFLDYMHDKLIEELKAFSKSAKVEMRVKTQSAYAHARDMARRQRLVLEAQERQQLAELQKKTLKQLQCVSRNLRTTPQGELRTEMEKILEGINIITVKTANEMNYSDKYEATWKDLARMYAEAKTNDPNWVPNKELDKIMSRVNDVSLEEMTPDELRSLYESAVALNTSYHNRNNMINDELHRTYADVAASTSEEISAAKKPKNRFGKKAQRIRETLNPIHYLEYLTGWNPDSVFYNTLAKGLENGERKMRRYQEEANQMLDAFLTENKTWIEKADGQGKDGIWYEYDVPELAELKLGQKPVFGETRKIYITPMQKVMLALESRNYDNLMHMMGGRIFPDKERYQKGDTEEAFSAGTNVKLAPETVKNLVKDLTEQEQALYDILAKYYNDYSKKQINETSNALYGYDKAMSSFYAPITTSKNYTKSTPGKFDMTAEGVGHMKGRIYGAKNPTLNISALEAFRRHVAQTSEFVGLAIPIENLNRTLNWYAGDQTVKGIIAEQWSAKDEKYINDLMEEIQGAKHIPDDAIDKAVRTIESGYIGATFAFNPSVAMKVFGSWFTAMGALNPKYAMNSFKKVDESLVSKYTSELDIRKRGYSTPELARMQAEQSKINKLIQSNKVTKDVFGGGWMIAADVAVAKGLWSWAEAQVMAETDLRPGTQEQVNSGTDEFYKEVARKFEEAIGNTQSMYDTMHRSQIMKQEGITQAFTMFHTDTLQCLNILTKNIGEARHLKAAAAADPENEALSQRSDKAQENVASAINGVVLCSLEVALVSVLNSLLKRRDKFEDEEGGFDWGEAGAEFVTSFLQGFTGMVPGWDVAMNAMVEFALGGKTYDVELPGLSMMNDLLQGGISLAEKIKSGKDLTMEDVKDISLQIAKAAGLPFENIEKYVTGILAWVSPSLAQAYDDMFAAPKKSDLNELNGKALDRAVYDMLKDYGISERDTKELARLYSEGYTKAIAGDVPDSITVDGETMQLTKEDKEKYRAVMGETLTKISVVLNSAEYKAADDQEKENMLRRVNEFAHATAKKAVNGDYDMPSWAESAQDLVDMGKGIMSVAAMPYSSKKASSSSESEDNRFTKLVKGGVEYNNAADIERALQDMTPSNGKSARDVDKLVAVAEMPINEDEKDIAFSIILGSRTYEEYKIAMKAGVLSYQYADFCKELDRINDNSSVSQKEFEQAANASNLPAEAARQMWYARGWKKQSPWG